MWLDFLTRRKQCVCVCVNSHGDTVFSKTLTINTPQGCVLSPPLFTLYTNDCKFTSRSCNIVKYADDSVLFGLIINDDEMPYRNEIVSMTKWCKLYNLLFI